MYYSHKVFPDHLGDVLNTHLHTLSILFVS